VQNIIVLFRGAQKTLPWQPLCDAHSYGVAETQRVKFRKRFFAVYAAKMQISTRNSGRVFGDYNQCC